MRRLHQGVGNNHLSAHDVLLTATQRANRDLANKDPTLLLSQTPTYLLPNHHDEAKQQGITTDAHATITTRTMSTLAETIAGATTAVT